MGVPLLVALLGPRSSGPVIVTLVVDLLVTTSLCIALSRFGQGGSGAALRQALAGMARNPMPWAIALGGLASALALDLPGPVMRTVGLLADAASPVALFSIGAVLARSHMQASAATPLAGALPVALAKLLLHPLLMAAVGHAAIAMRRGARPVRPARPDPGGLLAQRQQCRSPGRAFWRRYRPYRPDHPPVDRTVFPDLLRRRYILTSLDGPPACRL